MPPRKTRNSQSTEYARINRPGQPLFPHHPDPPAPAPDPPVPDPPPDPPPVAALWAPPDDPQDRLCQCIHHARAYRCRCINAITKEDYGYGYRLCSECRASPQQILDRTDQQTIALVNMIEDRGLHFDPPLDIQVSNTRYRETQINCGMPVCRCACVNCAAWLYDVTITEDVETDMFADYAQEMANIDLAAMTFSRALPEVFPEPIWTTEWWSLGRINSRDSSQRCARHPVWFQRQLHLNQPPLRDPTADFIRCEAEADPYQMESMQAFRYRQQDDAPWLGWHY